MTPVDRIDVVPLLEEIHTGLIALYRGLSDDDWLRPTVCPGWQVRDIAAHLLDTDLRRLSLCRDRMSPPPPDSPIRSDSDLIRFLNGLNADWVRAARRISPRVLIDLQDLVGPQVNAFWRELDPDASAAFAVSWAGETESPVWFDCAREYTERWHHQQQIREAVGAPNLTARHWLHPVLAAFLRALPVTYRAVDARAGTAILFEINGEAGGTWTLLRERKGWTLFDGPHAFPAATIRTEADTAWRIFTKGITPEEGARRTAIDGDAALGAPFLSALAIVGER